MTKLGARLGARLPTGPPPDEVPDSEANRRLDEARVRLRAVTFTVRPNGSVTMADLVTEFRRQVMLAALAATDGNITHAAALVGMQRQHLSRLVRRVKLDAHA